MAKQSMIEKNKTRRELVKKYEAKRAALKEIINNKENSDDVRFDAVLKLSKLPRNGSKIRIRNRCELTGRPHGYYRKFKLARVILRDLASAGEIPGLTKSSW